MAAAFSFVKSALGKLSVTIMINVFDIFVTVATIGLAVLGFREGFVRGALRLIGFIALIIALAFVTDPIVDIVCRSGHIPRSIVTPVFVVLFLIIGLAIIHAVSGALHAIVHVTPAGFIDNALGCAFGILKGLLVSGVLAIVLSFQHSGGFFRTQVENSGAANHLLRFMSETIPPIKRRLEPYFNHKAPPSGAPEQQDNDTRSKNFI